MLTDDELTNAINTFAASLSNQQLGLAYHHPEEWAQHTKCFENSRQKLQISGGRVQFGWIFGHRLTPHITNSLGYLMATHHAVWHSPNGSLIDVTPLHPDSKHHPIAQNGSVLFQVDDNAEPVAIKNYFAPLPSHFFPLSQNPPLVSYVNGLNEKEDKECKALYESLRSSSYGSASQPN